MIEFTSKKPKLSISLDGAVEVTFTAPRAKLEALTNLANKDFDVTVKQHREKRSLDANAYAWVLISAIADELRANKDEIYFDMLKRYGQGELISVKTGIDISGFVKYFEVAGYGKVNGVEFTHYRVYKGSSEYDTREMSIFIDGIVSEAQALGIDTRTPEELAELKSLWENGNEQ